MFTANFNSISTISYVEQILKINFLNKKIHRNKTCKCNIISLILVQSCHVSRCLTCFKHVYFYFLAGWKYNKGNGHIWYSSVVPVNSWLFLMSDFIHKNSHVMFRIMCYHIPMHGCWHFQVHVCRRIVVTS